MAIPARRWECAGSAVVLFTATSMKPQLCEGIIMKQIFLEQVRLSEKDYKYVVKRLTNATEPKVGTHLREPAVKGFCDDADWKVTIK